MSLIRGTDNRPNFKGLDAFLRASCREQGQVAVWELLKETVAYVPTEASLPRHRDGHSICHMLAARKPAEEDEGAAWAIYRWVLEACAEAGQLSHRNWSNATMVHEAAAQHNYVFLEVLREVGATNPGCVPWHVRGGKNNRTPWDQQFMREQPKVAKARRVAEIFCDVLEMSLPSYFDNVPRPSRERSGGRR